MRILIFAVGAALATLTVSPVSAQGCGGMQSAAQTAPADGAAVTGGMCGGGAASTPAAPETGASGGCGCCAKMAMMQPDEGMDMPMETPAEPTPDDPAGSAPEAPLQP